ncbi:MAG: FliH/SctL family protein [bacterium]|nr:FliH/SctL family protein [bacterium]
MSDQDTQSPQSSRVIAEKSKQSSYSATGFSQVSWEVMGEFQEAYSFEPINIEVMSSSKFSVDPMFEDYGSGSNLSGAKRWQASDKLSTETEAVNSAPLFTQEKVQQLITEAQTNARAAALEEARLLREQEIAKFSESTCALLKDLEIKTIEKITTLEKQALELSLAISKKIIDQAVEINPEYLVDLIKRALGLAGSATIKKVRISKQDMEFIEVMGISKKLKEYDGSWIFEADETINSGCLVETSAGEVDFQLDKAWERISDSIVKVLK